MALRHRMIGSAARLYWRVTRPRTLGVRGLVLDPRGYVALVRHTYDPHWYLPGGGVKRKESVAQALVRELGEEIALADVTIEHILGVYHSRREYKDDHVVVFVARTADTTEHLHIGDPTEIAEAGWFAIDALPSSVSPATARRIDEHRGLSPIDGDW